MLAPESPDRPAQVIDVRDLASWIVTCAENRLTGVYDATGHVSSLGVMLEEIARSVGGGAELVWVDAGFLQEHDVHHWAGPRSLPLWLPDDGIGIASHDVSAAFATGLTTRPIADTARTPSPGCARRRTPPAPASPGPRSTSCSRSGTRSGLTGWRFPTVPWKRALPVLCNVREVQVDGQWFHWGPSETSLRLDIRTCFSLDGAHGPLRGAVHQRSGHHSR